MFQVAIRTELPSCLSDVISVTELSQVASQTRLTGSMMSNGAREQ